MTATTLRRSHRGKAGPERATYRIVLAAGFLFFLAAALVECLMPWRWSEIARRWSEKSIVTEAMDAAKTTIPFAFMG